MGAEIVAVRSLNDLARELQQLNSRQKIELLTALGADVGGDLEDYTDYTDGGYNDLADEVRDARRRLAEFNRNSNRRQPPHMLRAQLQELESQLRRAKLDAQRDVLRGEISRRLTRRPSYQRITR
jgi:hypothetical protein